MRCLNPLKIADLSKKPVKTQTLTQNSSQAQRVRTLKGGGGFGTLPGASPTSWCYSPVLELCHMYMLCVECVC